jgi:hypothetical protein
MESKEMNTKGAMGNRRDNGIFFPDEDMLKQAIFHKIWIYDDKKLMNDEPDYMMMDHLLGVIDPQKFVGVVSWIDFTKVIWDEMQPYMKKLIVAYVQAEDTNKAFLEEENILLNDNSYLIEYLKYENKWEEFVDWKKHKTEQKEASPRKDI